MSAIVVDGLAKRYVIDHRQQYETLRDTLSQGIAGLFRRGRPAGPKSEEFWALQDVSFEVATGEVVGIIGRNGAGKSTLLKILSRITEPTRGSIRLRGRVASLLEVGTGFHPELTGRENIFLNGAILGMTRGEIRRKFDEIVAFAEVERFLDTPVKKYSSGMYVRLAFAVAAHLEPEILIVDEVLAVGDAQFQKKCLGKMKDVTREGRTVLFVSHNQAAIEALCHRAILLDAGRVAAAGPVEAAFRAYREQGGTSAAVSRVATPFLHWVGLANTADLQNLECSDPVQLRFRARAGPKPLTRVEFDCALVNERGQMVTHSRSRFLGRTFEIEANREIEVSFALDRPHLCPGGYTAIFYARDESRELLWVEGVEACRVLARSAAFPNVPLLDGLQSAVVPPFSMEVGGA